MAKALNLSSALVSSSVNEDVVSFIVCKELWDPQLENAEEVQSITVKMWYRN